MFKLILVPLDMSAFAEQALPHAVVLARRNHATLRLVTVRPSLPLDMAGDGADEKYLKKIAAELEPELPGAVTHAVLVDEFGPLSYPPPSSNAAADVIARDAREQAVDLIVMATHGHGGVRRAWLGSVADSLLRIAPKPVLLIRPKDEAFGTALNADRGYHHIVLALDGSDTAEKVIPYAVALGSAFGARYSLVRSVSPLVWGVTEPIPPAPPAPLSRRAALEYLDAVAARMRTDGAQVSTRLVEAYSPAPAIVEYADTHAADVIAISTEGAGRVKRMLLGSVTDKVIRSTDVAVLVCNFRHIEAAAEPEHELVGAAAPDVTVR